MRVIPLKIDRRIDVGDDLVDMLRKLIVKHNISPTSRDVIVISVKVISISKNSLVKLDEVKASERSIEIASKYSVAPQLVQLLLDRNVEIIGGKAGVLATINRGILIGNGGLDRKNVKPGYLSAWPDGLDDEAKRIRDELYKAFGVKVGVLIVDSRVTPLRRGTTAVVLGLAGLKPLKDYRGKSDIYGKPIMYTIHNIADELACAAHIYMGEGEEGVPFVYIQDAPIETCDECTSAELIVPKDECIYFSSLHRSPYNDP